jgi:hypothetical protein
MAPSGGDGLFKAKSAVRFDGRLSRRRHHGLAGGCGGVNLFVDMDRGARIICLDVRKNGVAIR